MVALAELRQCPLDLFYWTTSFWWRWQNYVTVLNSSSTGLPSSGGTGRKMSHSSRPLLLDHSLLVALAELRHSPLDLFYWTAVFWWRWQNYVTVL